MPLRHNFSKVLAYGALKTATLFRNVSDFLRRDAESINLDFLDSESPSRADMTQWATVKDVNKSTAAMSLYLLHRLMLTSTDRRLEVRNSKCILKLKGID